MKILITSGPTQERIDPVRYLTNDSSGKQGHAIAAACAKAGMDVVLVSGPVHIPDPASVRVVHVHTADEMLAACERELPCDIALCAAAVSDWRAKTIAPQKLKKHHGQDELTLTLVKNPDILAHISHHPKRPSLVIGFAAETENLIPNARNKLASKGCDWIVANDVSGGQVFGQEHTSAHLITADQTLHWENLSKTDMAARLVEHILTCITV